MSTEKPIEGPRASEREIESLGRVFFWSTLGGAALWVALVLLFIL